MSEERVAHRVYPNPYKVGDKVSFPLCGTTYLCTITDKGPNYLALQDITSTAKVKTSFRVYEKQIETLKYL